MTNNNNNKNKSKLTDFITELSFLFKKNINIDVINQFLTKSRLNNSKTNIQSLIYYVFNTFFIDENKSTSADKVKNFLDISRESLSKRAKKLPLEFFEHLKKQLFALCQKYFCNKNNKFSEKIIASDGTTSLDQNFDVCLNIGFYDVTNDLPINLSFEGHKNRNKDVKITMEYIKNNMNIFKNSILVFDAFYYTTNFIDFLITNNLYFIIRGRKKVDNYNTNKKLVQIGKNRKNLLEKIRKSIKITSYDETVYKKIKINRKKDNFNKTFSIEITNTINLISFLPNSYDDEKIKTLYKRRWAIETFFFILKNNFNFKKSNKISDEEHKIKNECALIITYIIKSIKKFALLNSSKKSTNDKTININETRMFKTLKDFYLHKIISGNFNDTDTELFIKKYCPVIMTKNNRFFNRISLSPFTKWYTKSIAELSTLKTVVEHIHKNNIKLLTVHQKLLATQIKIISVND